LVFPSLKKLPLYSHFADSFISTLISFFANEKEPPECAYFSGLTLPLSWTDNFCTFALCPRLSYANLKCLACIYFLANILLHMLICNSWSRTRSWGAVDVALLPKHCRLQLRVRESNEQLSAFAYGLGKLGKPMSRGFAVSRGNQSIDFHKKKKIVLN